MSEGVPRRPRADVPQRDNDASFVISSWDELVTMVVEAPY
jgi:hypothetical protein